MRPAFITEGKIDDFIKLALNEDVGEGDHTSLGSIPEHTIRKAQLIIKDEGVIAGLALSQKIFQNISVDLDIEFLKEDGDRVEVEDIGFYVEGDARDILKGERLVLNCLQRMSGVATYTAKINSLIKGTKARLLDTRKTTPNFRICEKWAVAIGGGVNHRFGLDDMILLKDNHIDYAGGVKEALTSSIQYIRENNLSLNIEIEVRNLDELAAVLDVGGISRIMLDNMLPSDMRQAVSMISGRYESEASGGITEKNIREIAETGVDFISVGALTHSYGSLDISLKAF